MESTGFLILSVAYLVISIILFFTFLGMAKNLKLIKRKLHDGDAVADAIVLIVKGEKTKARDLIAEAFIKECVKELQINWFESDKCDDNVKQLIAKYTVPFEKMYPELNKEWLQGEYASVRKFFIDK
jgi:hypothetical protein